MIGRHGLRVGIAGLFVALLVGACSLDLATASPSAPAATPGAAAATPRVSAPPESVTLTVFAASSLTDAMKSVKSAYEAETPGVVLTFSFAASSALRAQVEQGAPADLFLSADIDTPAGLVDAGLTNGAETPFAGNRLALVIPHGTKRVAKLADLAKSGVRIVAAANGVPITTYATALVAEAAKTKGYPNGFAADVARNIVSREENARAVLAKVVLGEADAGFVYATDAASAGDAVDVIPIADALNPPTAYAGVVLQTTSNPDAAAAFMGWLVSDAGQAVLVEAGLLPVTE